MTTQTKPTMLEAALTDYGHTTESFILGKHKKVLKQNDFMSKAPQENDRDKIEAYVATYHAYRANGIGHDVAMLRSVNDVLGKTIPENLSELGNDDDPAQEVQQESPTDNNAPPRKNGSTPDPKSEPEQPPMNPNPEVSPRVGDAAGELMHIGHAESPVTVHPDWRGDVLDEYNGIRYAVAIREGGTAEQALHIISEYRKFWDMGKQYGVVCAQYDPDEGKLETGGKGTLEFDRIVWSAKTYKGETSDYLEFWREGRDYASNSTRKAEEIQVVEQALGVQFKSGQPMTLEGGFVASYTLGNIKKDKEGKDRPGTKWFDFYLNIEGVTRK